MNTSTLEFVWRRLEEPAELFGWPLGFEPRWWLGLGVPLLLLALAFMVRSYIRESRTVGKGWAALLGTLRTLVYLLLFFIWLLPAMRKVETSTQNSKVLVLFDVSASVQTSDAPPSDEPNQLRQSRQELLLDLLNPKPVEKSAATPPAPGGPPRDLLARLLERNPLVCYRFGEVLDQDGWTVTSNTRPTLTEWTWRLLPSPTPRADQLLDPQLLAALNKAARQLQEGQNLEDPRSRELAEALEKALGEQRQLTTRLLNRTNLGAALREALRKESTGNLQGVILVSDGRATAGSEQELEEALALARKEKIPVFTLGLGRDQRIANLRLVDLLAPNRIQPEDEFPVRVAIEGENLPAAQPATVELKIAKPNGTTQELKQTVTLPAAAGPSRAAAEFRLDNPEKLKGDWKLTARLLPLKGERTRADNFLPEAVTVKVEDRKLAVLLISSGPLKDYQFLRNLLMREPEKFEVSVWLQSAQPGTVQDVDPKRLLSKFPTDLRDRDADPMNLGNYDVIVAFDPDWRLVSNQGSAEKPSPQTNLRTWVENLGGGLVVVAGPVHSFSLARDPNLQTLRYLYPVLLDDTAGSILQIERLAKEPFALNWDSAATAAPFLDLTDSGDAGRFLEGWELFFHVNRNPQTGVAEGAAERGFFGFFPLLDAKQGTQILARYGDPDPKMMTPGGQRQPFFVLSKVGKGPVFYIGSPEIYRLRHFSEKFHERFWTKLLRQMGKRDTSRGLLVVGSRYLEGETVAVEIDLLDANLKPLARGENVTDMRLIVTALDGTPDQKPQVVLEDGVRAAMRRILKGKDGNSLVTPDEEEKTVVPLRQIPRFATEPEIVGQPGKFYFRFPARRVGRYRVELQVPGSSTTLSGRFQVEAADPERDDPRPNLELLHAMATPARGVQLLDSAKKPAFLAALAQARQALANEPTKSVNLPLPGGENERLYFDLETAPWIGECLDANPVTFRTEGKATDLWDKGWNVFSHLDDPDQASGPSWALVLLITLLGVEWLSRKLLRLA